MQACKIILYSLATLLAITSCGKGYEVRVTNRYIEDMDSVIVGDKIAFVNIIRPGSSEYQKLEKGTYNVYFITKTKQRFNSSITIPKRKQGKRTIQIDGGGLITILTD